MTYQIFQLPKQTLISGAAIKPSWKVSFFLTGTTTPTPVYTTSALSTTHTQPVQADSGGTLATVYLDPSIVYKASVYDQNDVLQYTVDPVNDSLLSQAAIGLLLYPRTTAEISAGVTPANYAFPPGDVRRYGAHGDGVSNDTTPIQYAIQVIEASGGGFVDLIPGGNHIVTAELTGGTNVIIRYNGAWIRSQLSGTNESGLAWRSGMHVWNGKHTVESSGTPGSQGSIHSPFRVGNLYGLAGTPGALSAGTTVSNWGIHFMEVSTDCDGKVGVGVIGDVSDGIIEGLKVPDNADMFCAIGIDWGSVGPIDASDIAGTRTDFDNGDAYTTHPHNIDIFNLKVGALTRSVGSGGSIAVRLSGVHAIRVDGVDVDQTTYAGFFHTAGDCGYEFALAANKPNAHKLVRISNYNVKNANDGWGCFVDCYADNVASAVGGGYSPILSVIATTDILIEKYRTYGSGGASAQPGFRLQNMSGGELRDCEAKAHQHGILGETGADWIKVTRGEFSGNREKGIYIHHGTDLPEDWLIDGVKTHGNATDSGAGTNAGVHFGTSRRCRCINSISGKAGESTQDFGFRISSATVDSQFEGNYVDALATSGTAYAMASSTDYGSLALFRNNRQSSGVTAYAGIDIIPVALEYGVDGIERRRFRSARAVLSAGTTPPGTFTGKVGDIIEYEDPITADYIGTVCTTAGTPGTWKRYGATT